jgi:hypothetical protein
MAPRCYQSLDNGQRCSALAIHGSKFCSHHDLACPPKSAKERSQESEPLMLPLLLDKPSTLAALNQVLQALGEGRIKRSVAETLLSGIKLAHRLITEIAEAGLSVFPATTQFRPTSVALAASSERPNPAAPFNPAHPSPDHSSSAQSSNLDPSTASLVRELVAKSHEAARSQNR